MRDYYRYADNFVIVHGDPDYLLDALAATRSFLLETLALELHPCKVEIRQLSQGVDFLGYVILPHHRVLRTTSRRRMMKRLLAGDANVQSGFVSEERFYQVTQSYLGLLKHYDGHGLSSFVQNNFERTPILH